MAATITSNIASLILSIDDPGRDDLVSVLVWASTTNGFTPGPSNLVYQGNGLTVLISNLDPLQTYYVRYALVSDIDSSTYTVSAQLSGTPNLIDGNLTIDGTIRGEKIRADAIRGKMLVGSNLMDKGTLSAASFGPLPDELNTGNMSVIDTGDFRSSGGALAIYISRITGVIKGAYSGKVAAQLNNVRGFINTIPNNSVVVPVNAPSTLVASWGGGSIMQVGEWWFRSGGGSAIMLDPLNGYAGSFIYTGMTISGGQPALTGVSGAGSGFTTPRIIVDNNSLPQFTIGSSGTYTSLTISNPDLLTPGGGICHLVGSAIAAIASFPYRSINGTTLTIPSTFIAAGTYFLIPIQTNVIIGRDDAGVIQWSNATSGLWQVSQTTADANSSSVLRNLQSYGFTRMPAFQASRDPAAGLGGYLVGIDNPGDQMHVNMVPVRRSDLGTPGLLRGTLGVVDFNSDDTFHALAMDGKVSSTWTRQYFQPISTTLRFSAWDVALDGIVFTGTTFRFDVGGTSGAGNIRGTDVLASGKVLAGMITGYGGGAALQTVDGVSFPATAVAVADANTLDDYEEGTFTPTLTFATAGDLSVTYATRTGSYIKVGKAVHFTVRITTSAFTHTTASGALRITGLPFTVSSATGQLGAAMMRGYTKAAATQVAANPVAGQTYANMVGGGSGQQVTALQPADVPTGGTVDIYISGTYLT